MTVAQKVIVTQYRHRGFKCPDCGVVGLFLVMTHSLKSHFTLLPPPSGFVVEWDEWVSETKVVKPYCPPNLSLKKPTPLTPHGPGSQFNG